ncbi:hypothetical protein [Kocuria gwangalliensis]
MMKHRARKYTSLMAALGLAGVVAGCSSDTEDLPAFDSLNATYQAVDEVVDCSEDVSEPPVKSPGSGTDAGESELCTNTVEVLWFDNDEARDDVYELLASAAGSAGAVYFVEGRNWFVADYSEVQAGSVPEREIDMEQLAEVLDAQYTVEQ